MPMTYQEEILDLNSRLREKGVKRSISELSRKAALCPDCVPIFLKLLKLPYSLRTRAELAEALFAREPDRSQKREATAVLLKTLKQNIGTSDPKLCNRLADLVSDSTLIDGELIGNADASHVREIGQMVLDGRYGGLREQFIYALRQIGNKEAIGYLKKTAADPEIAVFALGALKLLGQEQATVELSRRMSRKKGVVGKYEIKEIEKTLKVQARHDEESERADAFLQKNGVKHSISELLRSPGRYPGSAPYLIDLFKYPFSDRTYDLITQALFSRKLDTAQQQRAVAAVLKKIREFDGKNSEEEPFMSNMVVRLADNVGAEKVDELGKMMLDKRYGELRGSFSYVLCKIGTDEAVDYLKRGTKDIEIASLALECLARLRIEGTIELCEQALETPEIRHKDAIDETLSKLKRQSTKSRRHRPHVTIEQIPKDFTEWSVNLDGSDLPKVLRGIQQCVKNGFGQAETSEVRAAADALSPGQTARLKFPAKLLGKEIDLWLEVFCDDEDAFDLYVFSSAELVGRIEKAMEKILK